METSGSDASLDNPTPAVFVFAHDAGSEAWFLLRSLEEVQGSFGLNQQDFKRSDRLWQRLSNWPQTHKGVDERLAAVLLMETKNGTGATNGGGGPG